MLDLHIVAVVVVVDVAFIVLWQVTICINFHDRLAAT